MAPRPLLETGRERRTARRGWAVALLGLAAVLGCILIAALWAGRDEFASHRAYLLGDGHARIRLDYTALSPGLDAQALQALVAPAVLHCTDAQDRDGRLCEAALAQANGVAAARLRAHWDQGRLQQLEVFVPWWAHHGAAQALTAQQGAPTGFDTPEPGADTAASLAWSSAAGTLRLARAPGWNPWRWSVLHWSANPAPRN